jgi:hypothetical protein
LSSLAGKPFRVRFREANDGTIPGPQPLMGWAVDDVSVHVCSSVPSDPDRLFNISTRGVVGKGDEVMIGGFIIQGKSSKTVLIRARGPSLDLPAGVDTLADPLLKLYSGDTLIASNDDWKATQQDEIDASGGAPPDDAESALLIDLDPGPYTAIVEGVGGGTGVGIVEVFDSESSAEDSWLWNISTRAWVDVGDRVTIGGFIIQGESDQTVLIRARGPSLELAPGVQKLADPRLDLYSGPTLIASNDDWRSAQEQQIDATGGAPPDDLESAVLITLSPGAYTAIVRGADGGTGVGIVEVFGETN